MDTNSLNQLLDQFAGTLMAWRGLVKEVIRDVATEELPQVIEGLREEAKPQPDRNFPMPDYTRLAEMVEAEYCMRLHIQRARELQCEVYCVEHAGDRKLCAHLHEE